jgi:hypothetical protein
MMIEDYRALAQTIIDKWTCCGSEMTNTLAFRDFLADELALTFGVVTYKYRSTQPEEEK